jgi:hypothetical protein
MKVLKKVAFWVLLSLVLQVSSLWVVNDVYLPNRGEILEVNRYDDEQKTPASKEIKTSGDFTDLMTSFDCSYAAYLSKGELHVFTLYEENKDRIINEGKTEIQYYKWLQDRQMIIYTSAGVKDGEKVISIGTYDAGTGIKREYPQIKNLEKDAEIYSIEPSPMTNTVYVILKTKNKSTKIYKYDIVENLSYITKLEDIYSAFHLIHTDGLIIQNNVNQLFILGADKGLKRVYKEFAGKLHLLGTDSEGRIYIGESDSENNMKEIIISEVSDFTNIRFKSIKVKEKIQPEDICITYDGRIYASPGKENKVLNPVNGGVTHYPGKFVQLAGEYIVSVDKTKLIITKYHS